MRLVTSAVDPFVVVPPSVTQEDAVPTGPVHRAFDDDDECVFMEQLRLRQRASKKVLSNSICNLVLIFNFICNPTSVIVCGLYKGVPSLGGQIISIACAGVTVAAILERCLHGGRL